MFPYWSNVIRIQKVYNQKQKYIAPEINYVESIDI